MAYLKMEEDTQELGLRQFQYNLKEKENSTSAPKLPELDQSPPLHTLSPQAHNPPFASSAQSSSKIFEGGLSSLAEDQDKSDNVSILSLPSLTSSRISSVRTTLDGICLTPEPCSMINFSPPMRTRTSRFNFSNESRSEASQIIPIFLAEKSHKDQESAERSGILGLDGNNVDWKQWFPTKFECQFCKERFLVCSQLRNHLTTHKRHRKNMRREQRYKDLAPDYSSNMNSSNQEPLHHCLFYQKPPSLSEEPKLSSCDDQIVPGDRKNYRSSIPDGILGQGFKNLDPLHGLPNETKKVASTAATCCEADLSFLEEGALNKVPILSSSPVPLRGERKRPKMTYFTDSDSEDKAVALSNKTHDPLDVPIFDLELGIEHRMEDGKPSPAKSLAEPMKKHLMDSVIEELVVSMRQHLVARIMDEFLIILKQDWKSCIRACTEAPGSTPTNETPTVADTSSQQPINTQGRQQSKIHRHDRTPGEGTDEDEDEDGEKAPKRPRTTSSPQGSLQRSVKFSCPYRKNDPRTYCARDWHSCALTPLDTIARVKAHLYRHHRIYQCQRCKASFANQHVLDRHIISLQGCQPNLINLAQGVTEGIEKKLRCRKKAHRNQTEAERWIEIYQILFPTALVPSPFFEPIEEKEIVDHSPHTQKLADFEEYARQKLPRIFWTALEEAATNESQLVEERLRGQLMDLIQNCQDRVFSTYQSMLPSTMNTLLHNNTTQNKLSSLFEPLCRSSSEEDQLQSSVSLPSLAGASNSTISSDTRSDAGCVSNLSAFNSSTTLSSIFNSSTTLSSILSSEPPPQIQLPHTNPLGKIDERAACIFGINESAAATASSTLNDFWVEDLDEAELSQFDPDGLWGLGTTIYEKQN